MLKLTFCILYRNAFLAYVSLSLSVSVFSSISVCPSFKKGHYSVKQRPDCGPSSLLLNRPGQYFSGTKAAGRCSRPVTCV